MFTGCGVWGNVDFDSKYKILWGETRAHDVLIHEERIKFKTRIYLHNYSNISTPLWYQIDACWGGGGVLPSRLSKLYPNMACSRQLFWLVDLPLDVYLIYTGDGLWWKPITHMCL